MTHVHVRAGRSDEERAAIIDAVHDALVAAIAIPVHDRTLVLHEHAPVNFAAHRGPDAVLIEVTLFAGRSGAAKRALYRAIVDELHRVGVRREAVTIALHDVPRESWGVRGGQCAADIDLGFEIEV